MSNPQIWQPNPQYGLEIPDVTTVVYENPLTISVPTIQFPAIAYHHIQGSTSNLWTINHNLNFNPNVTVVDSAGTNVEGEVRYVNGNTTVVAFQSAFSGDAYLS
jgi:hypothetical protein